VRAALARRGLQAAAGVDEATAVCCTNDVVAIRLIDELEGRGVRVPEDVSVVGFDDIPLAAHRRIDLTTVRQPAREMGRMAAEMALSAISERRPAAGRVVMPTELVVRGSSGPVRSRVAV
jgi:DNA-binding LacI/PurR family transcriptional regulator